MMNKYEENASNFKTLADTNRLKILSMLSTEELCACDLLDELKITQPTLSYHMKLLCDINLVYCRKSGKKMLYRINNQKAKSMSKFLCDLLEDKS